MAERPLERDVLPAVRTGSVLFAYFPAPVPCARFSLFCPFSVISGYHFYLICAPKSLFSVFSVIFSRKSLAVSAGVRTFASAFAQKTGCSPETELESIVLWKICITTGSTRVQALATNAWV